MITINRLTSPEEFPDLPVQSADFDRKHLLSLFGPEDYVWLADNKGPLAAFGLAKVTKLGNWYLWIALFRKPKLYELRFVFPVIRALQAEVGVLSALVTASNETALKFCAFCGFTRVSVPRAGVVLMEKV